MKRSFINSFGNLAKILTCAAVMICSGLQVNAQAVVTATGAGPGPASYPSLNAAFTQINAGTHTGNITITIGAAGTNEFGTMAVLNASGVGAAAYTAVLIKPAAGTNPVITGSIGNNPVIKLFGASNVTIDGSNTVGGTTKNLTINNTSGVAASAVIQLGNNATTGASNNTIKNCKIHQNSNLVGMCIFSGNGVPAFLYPFTAATAGTVPNSNNVIENDSIYSAQTGFLAWGPPTFDVNWSVRNNVFSGLGFTGAQLNNSQNGNILDNNINNISINGNSAVSGIVLSFACNNVTIAGNKISNVNNTYNFAILPAPAPIAAAGIYLTVNTATSSANVYNNFISNVVGVGHASLLTNGWGIVQNFTGTFNIHHNSIKLSTPPTLGTSACVFFGPGAAGSASILNNLIINSQGAGARYGIYSSGAAVFTAIDYNDYFAISGNLGFIGGIARTNIAAMIAGFGGNTNSINPPIDPVFISPTDLHLQTNTINFPLAAGTPIAGVTTDIDGTTRSVTAPTIGAHELSNKITLPTPLPTSSCNSNFDTLTPVVIESPSGVPLGGGLAARVYYRKGAGPWVSTAGTPLTGATATLGNWRFIIDASLMGGVVAGDVISYFVVAQTTGGTVFSNPVAGMTAVDVNTILTPPTTPNTYTVNATTLIGLTTSNQVCFNPTLPQTRFYGFTGTTGAPTQYTLFWAPVGPPPVPVFSPLPGTGITVNVPAGLAAGPSYAGTVTIRNAAGCQSVYNISLAVNPLPGTITGPLTLCAGTSGTLSSTSTGGTWSSGTPAVATVGLLTGVVNGLTGGTTNIVYTLPTTCSTFANVNVVTPPGPILGPGAICPNLTITLTNATPGGTWTSSNTAVATIDPVTGVVTGLMPGTTVIAYSISGCSPITRTIIVNTVPNPITGTLYACQGFTTTLSTTSTGGTWSSGDPTVATIGSATGVVSGIGGGTAAITYAFVSTGCIITNTVTIYPAPGPITGGPIVCQGLSTTLSNSIPGGTWTSSLPGVISIGLTSGVATGVAASGTALISYILPTGCNTQMVMTVSTPPTSIAGTAVVCSEYTITLTNGTAGGTWTSSNTSVATVGASSGVVTGVAGGTVVISYVTTACNPVIYNVTVNQTPPPITGGITLCNGGPTSSVFNAMPGGAWTISGPASISPIGVITGLTVGATNIVTYTVATGCYRTAPIIVDTLPAPIQGIDSICQGRSTTLTTASTGGLWSSNNAVIASVIASSGVVTGVNHGSTTITYASLSGCYRTIPFRVINPLPASVSIIRNPPMPDTLCAGTPVTFTANPVNGGAAPTYQWQNFGVNIPGETTASYVYAPTHGDVIRVFMYNSLDICAAPTPAYVDIANNVYPVVAPSISMVTSTPTTTTSSETYAIMQYLGQVVTFNTLVTSGGPNPAYQWFVDGAAVPGATNSSYARTVYDNDVVYCRVNGNPACEAVGTNVANSNSIHLYADWLQTNTVTGITSSLSLFPNPNTGSFTLSGTLGTTASEELVIDVLNVLGQVIYTANTVAANGNINYQVALDKDVAAGTYMLRVNSKTEYKVFHFVIGE